MYTLLLNLSIIICTLGILYRVAQWFLVRVEQSPGGHSFFSRIGGAVSGIMDSVLSRELIGKIRILLSDVLLQRHILKENRLRWLMHFLIFAGFTLLLLMHALADIVTVRFFPGYASTQNPFMFLRNLFGLMVAVGIGIAVYRRLTVKGLVRTNRKDDWIALIFLGVIIGSGFLLESAQIVSPGIFYEMTRDYGGTDDPEEVAGLKALWAKDFGVVFPDGAGTENPELLAQGKAFHEESCRVCHVRPKAAFVSNAMAKMGRPAADILNSFRIDIPLWWLHVIACFAALAWLPFGKFFHLVSTPARLLAKEEIGEAEGPETAGSENLRALSLDACTHCGTCSHDCSVAPAFQVLGNPDILPSEKLASLKALRTDTGTPVSKIREFAEGSFICTECGRCTELCPSGIDLHDLWRVSREDLVKNGYRVPHVQAREHQAEEWAELFADQDADARKMQSGLNLTDRPETFWGCVQCTICTNVCPVVAASDDPESDLDMTPQQIMNLMRLQMKETALGARMVWDCLTCYSCQEHCPQGVRVADIFYELRNIATQRMRKTR